VRRELWGTKPDYRPSFARSIGFTHGQTGASCRTWPACQNSHMAEARVQAAAPQLGMMSPEARLGVNNRCGEHRCNSRVSIPDTCFFLAAPRRHAAGAIVGEALDSACRFARPHVHPIRPNQARCGAILAEHLRPLFGFPMLPRGIPARSVGRVGHRADPKWKAPEAARVEATMRRMLKDLRSGSE
jgi:hypothetical protein